MQISNVQMYKMEWNTMWANHVWCGWCRGVQKKGGGQGLCTQTHQSFNLVAQTSAKWIWQYQYQATSIDQNAVCYQRFSYQHRIIISGIWSGSPQNLLNHFSNAHFTHFLSISAREENLGFVCVWKCYFHLVFQGLSVKKQHFCFKSHQKDKGKNCLKHYDAEVAHLSKSVK